MNYFDGIFDENIKYINEKFNNNILIIEKAIEIEMNLYNFIKFTLHPNVQAVDEFTPILLSGFYKSLLSILGAYELTKKGEYGSSRILLRHAYEYLLVSKYCSISMNIDLLNRWEQGKDVVIGKDIFNKLSHPEPVRMRQLWKILCMYTHATRSSQQIDLDAKNNYSEINTNFALIRALLEMNYHLFNRHFINKSMSFYFAYFSGDDVVIKFKELKKEARSLFSVSKKVMSSETKGVIRDYISSWQL